MARIRSVKPEFFTHPILGRLPAETQLMALGLISTADDEGYFRADPALIRAAIAPFRESLASISEDVAKLTAIEFIEVRVHPVQGPIGRVTKWAKHQKVDHPSPSKFKDYFLANDSREIREDSGTVPEPFAPDQGSRIKDQGVPPPTPPAGGEAAAAPTPEPDKPVRRVTRRRPSPDLTDQERQMRELWNANAEKLGLTRCLTANDWLPKFREMVKRPGWWESVPKALQGMDEPFFRGENRSGWKATLEWFCREAKLDQLVAKAERKLAGNLNRSLSQADWDALAPEEEARMDEDIDRLFAPAGGEA